MRAMQLERIVDLARESKPLTRVVLDAPTPGPGEVLIAVSTCGVCHTELDEIEGRTPPPRLPVMGDGANGLEPQRSDRQLALADVLES